MKFPNAEGWEGYERDLDVRGADRLLFGRSIDQVRKHFGGAQSISRADDLLFMPRAAVQYFVFAFAQFVISDNAQGEPDSASPFLGLLISREERDPGSVSQIYPRLLPSVEFVASNQELFDADYNIYGSFRELSQQLENLCNAPHAYQA